MRKLILLLATSLAFQVSFSQRPDSAAIRRIGDYGRLWTVINLFHPDMAYGRINADSLFTDNIEDLLREPTAANFRTAIQKIITRLGDPYTEMTGNAIPEAFSNTPGNIPLLQWQEDSMALLHFDDQFIKQNAFGKSPALLQLIDNLRNARGLIIDLTEPVPIDDGGITAFYKQAFIKQLISQLIDHPLIFPAYRSRVHNGHVSQTNDISFYYQGWFLRNGAVVYPQENSIHKPVCLLINSNSRVINDAIAAMQNSGIARVIAFGALNNFEPSWKYFLPLADGVNVQMRISEVLYASGEKHFSPDTIIARNNLNTDDAMTGTAARLLKTASISKEASRLPVQNLFASSKVAGYELLKYPPASLRLLALMRYWTAIQFFCPNKNLIKKNWDSVLYEYVPQFLMAKDSLDYALTAARLIKEINDGHGFFFSPVHSRLFSKAPEVQLKFVENKTIFYKVFKDSLRKLISTGDEIIAVDGRPVKKHRDSIGQYIGASNESALQRDITPCVLAGTENSYVNISYLHNGKQSTIKLQRTVPVYQYYYNTLSTEPVWKKLDERLGYVDFGRLEMEQVGSMFHDLNNTEAIILDDRSYPRGTVWEMINYLSDKPVKAAIGTTVIADSPDPSSVTIQETVWELPVTPKPRYKGRIIVLVNETTQSQAEYSCMVLQAACKNITIIGSQTAGADGDVTGILLPGGIKTAFSGHGVYYPDRRPTQGIGIVPDIEVKPTIKGIITGKDEVLERAIQFAKTGK